MHTLNSKVVLDGTCFFLFPPIPNVVSNLSHCYLLNVYICVCSNLLAERALLSSSQNRHTHTHCLFLFLLLSLPFCLCSLLSHASDPSRCFHPFHILSSVGPHLLTSDTPLSTASSTAAVRSWTSQSFTMLHGSLQVNLAGRAAAAQFAHLRQSMKITLWDYNTKRHTKHKGLHTHTHPHAPVLLIVGY